MPRRAKSFLMTNQIQTTLCAETKRDFNLKIIFVKTKRTLDLR